MSLELTVDIKHFRNSPYFMSFSIWFLNYHQTRYRSDRSKFCSNLMRGKCCSFSCYTIALKKRNSLQLRNTVLKSHPEFKKNTSEVFYLQKMKTPDLVNSLNWMFLCYFFFPFLSSSKPSFPTFYLPGT